MVTSPWSLNVIAPQPREQLSILDLFSQLTLEALLHTREEDDAFDMFSDNFTKSFFSPHAKSVWKRDEGRFEKPYKWRTSKG